LKVELINLGIQSKVQDYTISKKLDDFGVVTDIDSKAKFDKDNGFETLLEQTSQGNTEEEALYTVECGEDDIEIEGYILHNEGSVNFNDCYAEKTLKFKSPIECIKNKDINIFDYTPSDTQTVQGDLQKKPYGNQVYRFLADVSQEYTLEQILAFVGPIPDYSNEGYFIEYISLTATPIIERRTDDVTGQLYDQYIHHDIQLFVHYIAIWSDTQINNYWRPHPTNGKFYYSLALTTPQWNSPSNNSFVAYDEFGVGTYYNDYSYSAGKYNIFTDVPISNTFLINEIIQDIFSCSELQIVSNFFNIDPDFSNPENDEYTFATDFLHELKIAQSYDIIRESAIDDSFGQSGLIKAKNFVLEFNRIFGLLLVYDSELDIMRWEHYTYFQNKGLDLELQEIEYELDDNTEINKDLVNIEKWYFAQPSPTDGFYLTTIDYQNYQLNSDLNEVNKKSDIFMTDLFGTLNNELYNQDSYKKLFFILSTDGTNVIGLNSSLSIRSLVENLHYKNRPMKAGLHDNRAVTFTGYSIGFETKVSIFGNFKLFNKINPGNTIKLNKKGKGTWLIDEVEIENEKITFTVKK